MKPSQPSGPKSGDNQAEELLGDLEFIRSLLEEDEPVEVHQQPVEEAHSGPEQPSTQEADEGIPLLNEDLFDTLLEDGWRESAGHVLKQVRESIGLRSDRWSPKDADELSEALRIRIDETLMSWMKSSLMQHLTELHDQLLAVTQTEISEAVHRLADGRNALMPDESSPRQQDTFPPDSIPTDSIPTDSKGQDGQ